MNSHELTTESLKVSICVQRGEKELKRAMMYLDSARDAWKIYAETEMLVSNYDVAELKNEPWTFYKTKSECEQQALVFKEKYLNCMEIYRSIIISLL